MKSIQFTYDAEKSMFFGPLQLESQQDEKSAHEQMVCTFLFTFVFILDIARRHNRCMLLLQM